MREVLYNRANAHERRLAHTHATHTWFNNAQLICTKCTDHMPQRQFIRIAYYVIKSKFDAKAQNINVTAHLPQYENNVTQCHTVKYT